LRKMKLLKIIKKYNKYIEARRKRNFKYFFNRYHNDDDFREKQKKYARERYHILKQKNDI
jgi:hypothetical protein